MMYYSILIVALASLNLVFILNLARYAVKYKRQRDVLYEWICDENWIWDDYPEEYCAACDEMEKEKRKKYGWCANLKRICTDRGWGPQERIT